MSNGFIKLIFVLIIGSIIVGGGAYLREVENKKSINLIGEKIGRDLEYIKKILEERRRVAESKVKNIIQEEQNKFEKNLGVDKLKTADIDTSQWKTYRNEKYGFEFRYPNNWLVDAGLKIDHVFYILGPHRGVGDVGGDQIDFVVSSNTKNLFLQQWLEENVGFEGKDLEFSIAGIKGLRRAGTGQISGDKSDSAFFQKNNLVFSFSASGDKNVSILDQILSTFKFIK